MRKNEVLKKILIVLLLFLSEVYGLDKIKFDKTDKIYLEIKQKLNYSNPGYGVSDYGNFDVVDIPKAYAMFLSAELMKYKLNNNYDLTMALNAGHWLLKNKDLNNNKIIGWGVPVAWDAFGDNSINEENTEYTIATGIVLNSLMDWLELSPETAPKNQILKTIKQAILPYLKEDIFSSSDLFSYSLKKVDRKYNCFNPAIYMAGQMQRFTKFIEDVNLKNRIYHAVDRVMSAALKYKKIDNKSGWYWNYSIGEKNIPNDLCHACYIVEGICTYIDNKGTLGKLFNKQAIIKHLNNFSDDNYENWYFYPSFFTANKIAPRLYGIGMLMHIYAKYIKDENRIKNLLKYIRKYKIADGLYSRWQNENIVITEYLTYLMYGLSSYKYYKEEGDTIFLHNTQQHLERFKQSFQKKRVEKFEKIPFTKLNIKNTQVLFDFKNYISKLKYEQKDIILDKYKAIPVKILDDGKNIILILRELITNHMILVKVNKKDYQVKYKKIDIKKNIFSDFREAIIFDKKLIIIVYESHKQQNTLLVYDLYKDKISLKLELPSVEDPAGKTYEVIPKIILLKSFFDKKLYIIGGRLFAEFDGKNIKKKNVPNDTSVFIEAIINKKDEVYALYKSKNNKFVILNLLSKLKYYESKNGEIIFDLAYYRDNIHFRKLKSINDLKDLIEMDFLTNKGSGTLYLGTNNLEGWMAWAQVYYLNGMLSFLELAKNDIEFFEIMKDYLPLMKQRLDLEIKLLINQKKSKDGLKCRVFSIDRSLATFAVQSSRFCMVLHRYLKLFPNEEIKKEYENLKFKTKNLIDHMEVLEKGTSKVVSKKWNPINAYYLKWPKGNKFYFDGLPVPYNHQNEWATFILETVDDNNYTKIASSMIELFLFNITKNNNGLPPKAVWPYWWAKAWEGWTEKEKISVNKKSYIGDKGNGWISFRTIDAIAVIHLAKKNKKYKKFIKDIKKYISNGYLYPFASAYLVEFDSIPKLKNNVIANYIRFTSPWEFDNCVWSYLNYIKTYNEN